MEEKTPYPLSQIYAIALRRSNIDNRYINITST